MDYLYVTGGTQKENAHNLDDFNKFKKAKILKIDVNSLEKVNEFDYFSPLDVMPEKEISIVFKAGTLQNNLLHVCTTTEVLTLDKNTFEIKNYFTDKSFNDLHHVTVTRNNTYLVVNTGLDMLMEFDTSGKMLNYWPVLDEIIGFDKSLDYRKIPSTKPHLSHPNYVTEVNGEYYVTRFKQKDSINIYNKDEIKIGVEGMHDGILYSNYIYFTTINGHIIKYDLKNGTFVDYDLNKVEENLLKSFRALGWCRGLRILDEDNVIVGFSRLRPTKHTDNVKWLSSNINKFKSSRHLPTRIARYNLKEGKKVWELNLEDYDLNAVFSIL